MITFFDYAVTGESNEGDGPGENPTGFFTLPPREERDEQPKKNFKEINQEMLDWVATMTDEQMAELSVPMTDPEFENPIINKEVVDKLYAGEIHYYQTLMYGES